MSTNTIQTLLSVLNKQAQSTAPSNSIMDFGTIQSVEPLSIYVDTLKLTLPAEHFFLGEMLRPHKVTIPHTHQYNGVTEKTNDGGQGASPHDHEIKEQMTEDTHLTQDYVVVEMYPKLAVGDRVLLFSFNDSQKYYVVERIKAVGDSE